MSRAGAAIFRYNMLLDRLMKKTEQTHKGYEPLKTAIADVRDVAKFINEV